MYRDLLKPNPKVSWGEDLLQAHHLVSGVCAGIESLLMAEERIDGVEGGLLLGRLHLIADTLHSELKSAGRLV